MLSEFLPATTTTSSARRCSRSICAPKNVCRCDDLPGCTTGGQGSSALSRPMRDDSPAASTTPHRLGERFINSVLPQPASSTDQDPYHTQNNQNHGRNPRHRIEEMAVAEAAH